jgi:pimeloyl-ACP methyl ester carboxylesterase
MELRAPFELLAFLLLAPLVRRFSRRGDGHIVLCLPGQFGDDLATALLRRSIKSQGYTPAGWGPGRNLGPTTATLARLRADVAGLAGEQGRPITIIGWSLGGIFARMLAREFPDQVRHVITLGSPYRMIEADRFSPGPRRNWVRWIERFDPDFDLLRHEETERSPLSVPATSIYARRDAMAPWQLSIDETGAHAPNPRAENVEIHTSHIGIATNPQMLAVVLDRLAEPPDSWHPYDPPRRLRRLFPAPKRWESTILLRRSDDASGHG